jgi:hypothetical protein
VGFFDADDSVCNVYEMWRGLDDVKHRQQVPLSQLSGTEPVTLTFTGHDGWDFDHAGDPVNLAYHWDYSVTIQRVDEAGNPL